MADDFRRIMLLKWMIDYYQWRGKSIRVWTPNTPNKPKSRRAARRMLTRETNDD